MNARNPMTVVPDWDQQNAILANFIKSHARTFGPLAILEAGCGRGWPFKTREYEYTLTGVDMDRKALEYRQHSLSDLHEAIEGDLNSIEFDAESFDVIYCSYVLEHIIEASVVLNKFRKWVRRNGLIIIKIPDPFSVHGYVTRKTPHWFHVFFYRYAFGIKTAGKPGHGPYRTYYHPMVSQEGIQQFCRENNLRIEAGFGYLGSRRGLKRMGIQMLARMVSLLTFGRLSARHDDLVYVIRKAT